VARWSLSLKIEGSRLAFYRGRSFLAPVCYNQVAPPRSATIAHQSAAAFTSQRPRATLVVECKEHERREGAGGSAVRGASSLCLISIYYTQLLDPQTGAFRTPKTISHNEKLALAHVHRSAYREGAGQADARAIRHLTWP